MHLLDDYAKLNLPLWFVVILSVVSLVIEICQKGGWIKATGKKAVDLFRRKIHVVQNHRRKHFSKTIASREFLAWQKDVLFPIYERVEKGNGELATSPCDGYDFRYEALYFRAPTPVRYPFDELYDKWELKTCTEEEAKAKRDYVKASEEDPLLTPEEAKAEKKLRRLHRKMIRRYEAMMKPAIRFPKNIGFMLDSIDLDGNFHFTARSGIYMDNVLTSHILEYELYCLYTAYPVIKKTAGPSSARRGKKNGTLLLGEDAAEFLLRLMPIRRAIHEKIENEQGEGNFFSSGAGRASLLGVQAMVFCKNYGGTYDVLRIRRSENVDAKAGFLQFIPSGGFSALDAGMDYDAQWASYSLPKALFREFLEECYGKEDFSGRLDVSPESVYSDPAIKKILEDPLVDIFFLGTACSLTDLRHELCFIIILDDADLADNFRQNEEAERVIRFIAADQLARKDFWVHNGEDVDIVKLNATSAALWNLVRGSEIYKEKIET